MNDAAKTKLKKLIEAKLAQTDQRLETLQNEIKPLKKTCAYDDAEYAFLCDDMAMKEREAEQLKKEYEDLQRALARIDQADYGLCEMCDEEIEEERLELAPNSKLCVSCMKESRSS